MFLALIIASSVAIIGGGPSGLVAAKEARECGLTPTVFEQGKTIGGIWKPEGGKAWESLRINNSRYASSFSDFCWDHDADDFPNQKEVYRYLCNYAEHFNLYPDVKLGCKVSKVERINDKWFVEWIKDQNVTESSLFDSVIICSGLFSKAFIPEISGLESFPGLVIHSESYRTPHSFAGKNVAVIGNSFSGCDIAAEISKKAKSVFHIFNRPYWLLSRYRVEKESGRMLPFDLISFRRCTMSDPNETADQRNQRINNRLYSFCAEQLNLPDLAVIGSPIDYPFLATSDTYLHRVKERAIIPKKGSIKQINENKLILSDESEIEVDEIVFSTGYRTDASFFDSKLQKRLDFQPEDTLQPFLLYKMIFHPEFPNMAFIGMTRFGIFFGIVELQARFACMTLSEKIPRPSEMVMQAGVDAAREMRNMKIKSQHHHGDLLGLYEDFAKEIGVLPNYIQLQEQDPILYDKLMNGPFTTASYRLFGFGNNPEIALKTIDEIVLRAGKPFGPCECFFHD